MRNNVYALIPLAILAACDTDARQRGGDSAEFGIDRPESWDQGDPADIELDEDEIDPARKEAAENAEPFAFAGTCEDSCGGQSADGCWCDDACAYYGDCCTDKVDVCDAPEPEPANPNSCIDSCGEQAAGGCWCDEQCSYYGDCCADVEEACTAPSGAAAGEDCAATAECEDGLVCEGIPYGYTTGKCVDTKLEPGQGDSCDADQDCNAGMICIGQVAYGEGMCSPEWMAGDFSIQADLAIPDQGSVSSEVVVYGLATAPVDIRVNLDLDHEDFSQLRVLLHDPGGETAVVWDNEANPESSVLPIGIPGDGSANGLWRLEIIDSGAGATGTLEGWTLELTSRWD